MITWIINFFKQQIVPGIYARRAERKVIIPNFKKIKEIVEFDLPKQHKEEALAELKAEITEQAERKKGLEDKIKSILFVISVSISAITFSLKDLQNSWQGAIDLCSLALLGLSIFYFVSSALLSIKSLMPVEFYQPHPEIEPDANYARISWARAKADNELKDLVKFKLLNDNINLRVQNATYAVLQLLRNGMLLFALFFLIAVYQKYAPRPAKPHPVFKATVRLSGGAIQEIADPYSGKGDTVLNLVFETPRAVKPAAAKPPVAQPQPAAKNKKQVLP